MPQKRAQKVATAGKRSHVRPPARMGQKELPDVLGIVIAAVLVFLTAGVTMTLTDRVVVEQGMPKQTFSARAVAVLGQEQEVDEGKHTPVLKESVHVLKESVTAPVFEAPEAIESAFGTFPPAPEAPASDTDSFDTSGVVGEQEQAIEQEPAPESAPESTSAVPKDGPISDSPSELKPAGPLPDLALDAFSHYGSSLLEGDTMSFSSVVVNNGDADTKDSFKTRLSIDKGNDGTTDLVFAERITGPLAAWNNSEALAPKMRETEAWRNVWTPIPGTHRAEACTDTGSVIAESNEGNNCASIVLEIKSIADNPDLTITSLNYSPQKPEEGIAMSFEATVLNQGRSRSVGSYVSLEVDGRLVARYRASPLRPDSQEIVEWKTVWRADVGEHALEVCADATGRITEPNEDNNCTTGIFSVGGG